MQDKHENNTRRVSQTVVENKLPSPPRSIFLSVACRGAGLCQNLRRVERE